ncbi:type II toxin-antitoxin system VapC family toxin [Comamonas sp. NLF-1-9]|uniref:type II toxin-antitoxin system VapC family toxin n=1 Tax=Comamonas sp. NLF-1-9 TaxID=2853163 RepID=UPI001C4704F5|nr:type II toxin-antitoxin system VapC family toxin [Comamonas sp. NLF-1-9]QXL84994.1 type II toxin-antitoxin system VapC family toxin [Comamonas sp. NLF-1-9]
MDIVADTNIFLAVVLNEPEKRRLVKMTSGASVMAPEILPYEIGNALSAMVKRRQLTAADALRAQEVVKRIPVRLVAVDIQPALQLALDWNIYAYDAYFLLTAQRQALPLLTLDRRMSEVGKALGIRLLE